ncbi:MAG: hypothetical protein WCG25_03540 [bacterium]
MKKSFLLMVTVVIILSSCGGRSSEKRPSEDNKNYTIRVNGFITSDGKEHFNLRNQDALSYQRGTTIAAVVVQIGTDSIQIIYASPEYGNGAYTWTTSIKHYNEYESLRIRTRVFEINNKTNIPSLIQQQDTVKN